jgi:SAM-dependent methyltransferase
MGSLIECARKEWYRLTTSRRLARDEWAERYWMDRDGCRLVPCLRCPNYDGAKVECKVPFGTPLRKCVAASLEAHLRGTRGLRTLELGYGRRSLARRVVEQSGGSWTGLEPGIEAGREIRIGEGGYGHAGDIPFADETFDLVFGIQSLEHWEEAHPNIASHNTYDECLKEVWRVLRPGGSIYFDAPMHLHGHDKFIMGDVPRILGLFDASLWTEVLAEKWRYEHDPLPPYPTPAKEVADWPDRMEGYDRQALDDVKRGRSVWLLALTARKIAA